jgi:transposase-like protein
VPNTSAEVLGSNLRSHVEPGATIFTDAHRGYVGLHSDFTHEVIDHAYEYVRGQVHTNGMENFWSLLKRAVKGTYVAVDAFHLDAYLAEQAFRYNERKDNDGERFVKTLQGVTGKRLNYSELTSSLS